MRGHQGATYKVAFNPDGSWLASASEDGTVLLWQVSLDALLAEACRRAERNLTRQEWVTNLGEPILDYHLTCGDYPGDITVIEAILEVGREYARDGLEVEALETFYQALEMDPSLTLVPEAELALVQGRASTAKGQVEAALSAFQRANELDPTLDLDPEAEVATILVETVERDVQLGVLAYQREVAWALDYLKWAVELAELDDFRDWISGILEELWDAYARKGEYELAFEVLQFGAELDAPTGELELEQVMAERLIELANDLVYNVRLDQALDAFQHAYEYDSEQGSNMASDVEYLGSEYITRNQTEKGLQVLRWSAELDPSRELEPEQVAASILVKNSHEFVDRGQYAEALQALQRAVELVPAPQEDQVFDLSWAYYDVCWEGSLEGRASLALPACQRAIELVPDYPEYRDGRGLARALTGDYPGAIEDFQYYLDNTLDIDPETARQRQAWIQALQNGQNPFDEETLAGLR